MAGNHFVDTLDAQAQRILIVHIVNVVQNSILVHEFSGLKLDDILVDDQDGIYDEKFGKQARTKTHSSISFEQAMKAAGNVPDVFGLFYKEKTYV